MIPKIIHYCWFGGNPKPKQVLDAIALWQQLNPDFIIKEWNESNFDYRKLSYTYEAYLLGKFAFVSDVARLYALLTEGGIYLDTDIRVLKPFDRLLSHPSFIGLEAPFLVSTACIGAEKGCNWIQKFLESYQQLHFVNTRGAVDMTPNTMMLTGFLNNYLPLHRDELEVLDIDILSAKLYPSLDYVISDRTICVHEFFGSWKKQLSYTYWNRIKYASVYYKVKWKKSLAIVF